VEITHSRAGDIPVLHLTGRLDFTTSPILENQLNLLFKLKIKYLVFDCRALIYVSSAGLRLFISTLRHLQKQGGSVAVAELSQPVRELFRLAGLDGIFLIQDSVEEAITILYQR
jgi:anti-anti-sigma factor